MEETGMNRWQGKVALVTGASAGIGHAVAHALAAAGMRVVLSARRLDRLEALKKELEAHTPNPGVMTISTDLRNEADLHGMFAKVRQEWGGVDVLINNAGLGRSEPMMDTDLSHLRDMLEVNVWALTVCIKEALADMEGKTDAAIINISSLAGHRLIPARNMTFYAATKHAVNAITEGLRSELQQRKSLIKIGMISPGMVETEFHQAADPGAKVTEYGSTPLKAEDIAEAVLYMLSTAPHVQINDILLRSTEQIH